MASIRDFYEQLTETLARMSAAPPQEPGNVGERGRAP